jgi:hypothetical protein
VARRAVASGDRQRYYAWRLIGNPPFGPNVVYDHFSLVGSGAANTTRSTNEGIKRSRKRRIPTDSVVFHRPPRLVFAFEIRRKPHQAALADA